MMHHLDGRDFLWLACPVIVTRHAISEVPLRATLECFAQAPRGGEGLCICSENIDVCERTTLKQLLATTLCGAPMADGVASTIPSMRPNGARSGLSKSTGPGCVKLERAGVNFEHFGEEIRVENDSILLAMAGIIARRAELAEAASATGAVLHAIISQARATLGYCTVRKQISPGKVCKSCVLISSIYTV